MAYSEKVIDHYENPRNVGSLGKKDIDVGSGIVCSPSCGDVLDGITLSEVKLLMALLKMPF